MSARVQLPLKGRWLLFLVIGVLFAAPFTRVTMHLFEALGYWLACAAAAGVGVAPRLLWGVGAQDRLRRGGRALATGLAATAFGFWIFPTPWHEWQEGSETYRRHRITGNTQAMTECGCDWSAVD